MDAWQFCNYWIGDMTRAQRERLEMAIDDNVFLGVARCIGEVRYSPWVIARRPAGYETRIAGFGSFAIDGNGEFKLATSEGAKLFSKEMDVFHPQGKRA